MSDPSHDRQLPNEGPELPVSGRRPPRSLGALGRLTPRLKLITAVVAAVALSAGVTSVVTAGANTNSPSVTYYACVTNATGVPYNIQTTGTPKCLAKDRSISWNQTGAQGPPGAQGPAGNGGLNGLQEFTASGSWTAPTGVTHVLIEAAGAGGGGGGGSADMRGKLLWATRWSRRIRSNGRTSESGSELHGASRRGRDRRNFGQPACD